MDFPVSVSPVLLMGWRCSPLLEPWGPCGAVHVLQHRWWGQCSLLSMSILWGESLHSWGWSRVSFLTVLQSWSPGVCQKWLNEEWYTVDVLISIMLSTCWCKIALDISHRQVFLRPVSHFGILPVLWLLYCYFKYSLMGTVYMPYAFAVIFITNRLWLKDESVLICQNLFPIKPRQITLLMFLSFLHWVCFQCCHWVDTKLW